MISIFTVFNFKVRKRISSDKMLVGFEGASPTLRDRFAYSEN